MFSDQPTDLPLAQLFDALPDSAFYLQAVRDDQQQLIDLELIYTNTTGSDVTRTVFQMKRGERMLGNESERRELMHPLFLQYAALLLTGETQAFNFLSPASQRLVHVTRSRMGDGILVIVRETDERSQPPPTPQPGLADLLGSILEASLSGIITYQSVRDGSRQITDFRFVRFNSAAKQMLNLSDDAVGKPMLDQIPGVKEAGLFNQFVRVVETGLPMRFETPFQTDNGELWYEMSVAKLGDGFVLTFNDITANKQAALAAKQQAQLSKQQADLLNSVLDGSASGIKALEAVRDASGRIDHFVILTINQVGAALYGQRVEEVIGKRVTDVFPGIDELGLVDSYREVTESRRPQRLEAFYEAGGFGRWLDLSLSPFDNGLVVTYTDISERKRGVLEVEQARTELQAVINNSQTGIFVFSPVYDEAGQHVDFRFKTVNRMVAMLVGQTPEALTGAVASNWFTSYRDTGLFERYKYTFDTGEEQRFDSHYNVDGFDVWFDVHSVKFGQDVLVTFTNYTDLKQAQLAVEQQADLLNSVLNSSINGIMAFKSVRDASGSITDFHFLISNDASNRMVSKEAHELVGKPLLSIFPGNVESGLFAQYVETVETGKPTRTEVYYNHDGLDFWLDISAQRLGDGFVVTFTDISVVKRAAQVIEQSAVELQTVIDTSQTGIFLFAPVRDETGDVIDFRFRVANRQLASYVGQEPEAVTGALGSTWFPDYKTNGLFDRYRHTYVTGEQQRFDFHYDGSGIDVWLDIMSTKVGDEVLVTFGDYTPLKQLQQQLEASVIDLQRSNRNLEQFAYVASHDLQEPLRKIQAFSNILQVQYAPVLGEQGVDMLQRMQSAANRMQILIKDVLAYSRIATKREAVHPVNLQELISDVLDDLETAITDKQAVITVDALPTVVGDAPQLRQLFQNLISNSLKFTKRGRIPELTLTSQLVRGREAGLPVSVGDENRLFCRINLADNGIGFDPNQAERIFQVFQRLHGRSEYQGTGIGLAIVQKVVENHQGYITAEGRPGEGATFTVLLPV